MWRSLAIKYLAIRSKSFPLRSLCQPVSSLQISVQSELFELQLLVGAFQCECLLVGCVCFSDIALCVVVVVFLSFCLLLQTLLTIIVRNLWLYLCWIVCGKISDECATNYMKLVHHITIRIIMLVSANKECLSSQKPAKTWRFLLNDNQFRWLTWDYLVASQNWLDFLKRDCLLVTWNIWRLAP